MRKIVLVTILILKMTTWVSAQSYMKVNIDRGDPNDNCDTSIDLVPYNTTPPYVITWWDNHWQPSTGLHATNICEGTVLTTEILDINCRHLKASTLIMPDSVPQVYLDTIIAVPPSASGMCDGSLTFNFVNVNSSYSTQLYPSGTAGATGYIYTNLCEGDYSFNIWGSYPSAVAGVTIPLYVASIVPPCDPFRDSLVLTDPTSPGACNGSVTYNSNGAPASTFHHYIYKPIGGGSVQVNPGPVDLSPSFSALCSGPHIVRTEIYGITNNYFDQNTIFVDDPLLMDSVWGNPGAGQIDTVYLSALTNCGINFSHDVDSIFISNMTLLAGNQFEFEMTVLQSDSLNNKDTILSYSTAMVDTSHQLCFDITFFCADTSGQRTANRELHSYIYHPSADLATVLEDRIDKTNFIKLYPNPVSGNLNVSNLSVGESVLTIISIDGRNLGSYKTQGTKYKIDLNEFPPGLYLLRVENNEKRNIQKFVIGNE